MGEGPSRSAESLMDGEMVKTKVVTLYFVPGGDCLCQPLRQLYCGACPLNQGVDILKANRQPEDWRMEAGDERMEGGGENVMVVTGWTHFPGEDMKNRDPSNKQTKRPNTNEKEGKQTDNKHKECWTCKNNLSLNDRRKKTMKLKQL